MRYIELVVERKTIVKRVTHVVINNDSMRNEDFTGKKFCPPLLLVRSQRNILRFKYGSNGNYDGNDGFSTPQIENKTRKNTLFFFRIDL